MDKKANPNIEHKQQQMNQTALSNNNIITQKFNPSNSDHSTLTYMPLWVWWVELWPPSSMSIQNL